jgi:hypothetical protein
VTTEQELKLAVLAELVVVVAAAVDEVEAPVVDGLVVGCVLDDVEGDELHAARRMAAEPAAINPAMHERTFGCSLIRPLDRIAGRCARRRLPRGDRRCGAMLCPPTNEGRFR